MSQPVSDANEQHFSVPQALVNSLNQSLETSLKKEDPLCPLIIREEMVSPFKFWREGLLQVGVILRYEIFQLVFRFDINQRQEAFDLAWKLSQTGRKSIITVTDFHYTVWETLRSPETSIDSHPNATNEGTS